MLTWGKYHTQNPLLLDFIAQILLSWTTLGQGFVNPWSTVYLKLYFCLYKYRVSQKSVRPCRWRCVHSESLCTLISTYLQEVTLDTNIWQDAHSISFPLNSFCLKFLSLWLSYVHDFANFLYLSETNSIIWVQGGQRRFRERHEKLITFATLPLRTYLKSAWHATG